MKNGVNFGAKVKLPKGGRAYALAGLARICAASGNVFLVKAKKYRELGVRGEKIDKNRFFNKKIHMSLSHSRQERCSMDNKTLHDVLVCLELQREMIMKLYEFCEGAKENRSITASGERRDWQREQLFDLKDKAIKYIKERDNQVKEKIKILKEQISPKE